MKLMAWSALPAVVPVLPVAVTLVIARLPWNFEKTISPEPPAVALSPLPVSVASLIDTFSAVPPPTMMMPFWL